MQQSLEAGIGVVCWVDQQCHQGPRLFLFYILGTLLVCPQVGGLLVAITQSIASSHHSGRMVGNKRA